MVISKLSFPSSFPSLLCFSLVILVRIQSSSSDENDHEMSPSCDVPFRCGDITAGYPFWGAPQPQSCGAHQELQLSCNDDEDHLPTMEIIGVSYLVKNIDPKARTVRISRKDYENGICSPEYPNTTINFELFNYSEEYQNITFLYDCPPSLDSPVNFPCLNGNGVKYKAWSIVIGVNGPGACNASVIVPFPWKLNWATMTDPSGLGQVLKEGFELIWKVGGLPCKNCTKSDGSCGANSGLACPPTSALPDLAPSRPPLAALPDEAPGIPPSSGKRQKTRLGSGRVLVGALIIVSILFISGGAGKLIWDYSKKKETVQKNQKRDMEAFVKNLGSIIPQKFKYSDVKKMTKSFSNKLGQGGYGDVYKGKLADGRLVAVKLLKESKGNGEEFINEVASICRTSHVNIVTLLGFCYTKNKRALIYEFMSNGSLDRFIFDKESLSTNHSLEWKTRYQIAIGIARGLEYLHRGCKTRIVHFDIKPHNILLNEDFCPKISDFGLAKLCKQKESVISLLGARGTVGYIAPEVFCRNFGEVSHKSDVYSYGMMVLEIVGGRKNIDTIVSQTSEIYFPNWIYKRLEAGKDFEFHGVVNEEEKEIAKKMIIVSMWCIQTTPSDRPSMGKVLEMLEGSLESLQVPPKPSLSVPERSPKHSIPLSSFSTSTSSHKPASQEGEICIDLSDK